MGRLAGWLEGTDLLSKECSGVNIVTEYLHRIFGHLHRISEFTRKSALFKLLRIKISSSGKAPVAVTVLSGATVAVTVLSGRAWRVQFQSQIFPYVVPTAKL